MARQTGVHHAFANEQHNTDDAEPEHRTYKSDYNEGAEYSARHISRMMSGIGRENMMWQWFFEQNGITPLVLRYETIARQYPDYVGEVAKYVGVQLKESLPPRKLVQLSNQKHKSWYDQFMGELIDETLERQQRRVSNARERRHKAAISNA
jgi:LPS sulfotransferase NodH